MNNKVDAIFIAANWIDGKNEDVVRGLLSSIKKVKSKVDKVFIVGQTKVFDMDYLPDSSKGRC